MKKNICSIFFASPSRFDLIDIMRQYLTNLAPKFYAGAIEAFNKNNTSMFKSNSTLFLDLLLDMDELLGTNKYFLLGNWLNLAKTVPNATIQDTKLYEFNARNQITLWGPNGEIIGMSLRQKLF